MNTGKDLVKDITEIRSMMERSSRFMSLSGISGIMAGIYALIGAAIAYRLIYYSDDFYSELKQNELSIPVQQLILIAVIVLVLALTTGILLSFKKAKKNKYRFWDRTAKRLAINLSIPLVTGGLFILIMFFKGQFDLMAPGTLIFYGLALINASKYTYNEVRQLGIIEIILGLLASWLTGYVLILWATGFGIMHIIFGIHMYLKYEK